MATNYEQAMRVMERGEAEPNPQFARELIALAQVRATLAIADELSGLVAEVKGLRHELHKLREQRVLKSA
jgi:hypothetical protein